MVFITLLLGHELSQLVFITLFKSYEPSKMVIHIPRNIYVYRILVYIATQRFGRMDLQKTTGEIGYGYTSEYYVKVVWSIPNGNNA